LKFADWKFYKVYFAEHSTSDVSQITRIQNSAFRNIHLPQYSCFLDTPVIDCVIQPCLIMGAYCGTSVTPVLYSYS